MERKLDLEVLRKGRCYGVRRGQGEQGKPHYEREHYYSLLMQSWPFLVGLIWELEVRTDTSVFP